MKARLLLFFCVLLVTSIAQASTITFGFTGAVSQVPVLDPDDPFTGSISSGTPFSGSYTFESTTTDGDASANGGSYTSSPGSLTVDIGGNVFVASDLLNIGVGNNFSGNDFYTVLARNSTGPDTFDISMVLQDTDGTALTGPALLTDAPAFSDFEMRSFSFVGLIAGNQVEISGDLSSLVCTEGCVAGGGTGTPVPEPGSVALLVTAVAGLGFARRRNFAWSERLNGDVGEPCSSNP